MRVFLLVWRFQSSRPSSVFESEVVGGRTLAFGWNAIRLKITASEVPLPASELALKEQHFKSRHHSKADIHFAARLAMMNQNGTTAVRAARTSAWSNQQTRQTRKKQKKQSENKLCFALEDVFHPSAGCYQTLFVCFNNRRNFSISTNFLVFFSCCHTAAKSEPQWRQHWKTLKWSRFIKRVFKGTAAGKCSDWTRTDDRLLKGKNNRWTKWSEPAGQAKKITVSQHAADAGKYLSEVWFVPLQPSWYHRTVAISFFISYRYSWASFSIIIISKTLTFSPDAELNCGNLTK